MADNKVLPIFVGWDSREAVATEVAAYSIQKRTRSPINIKYLKHRELRKKGLFNRPWLIEGSTGGFRDLVDDKPFSTEFSHTRFLVPALMNYQGWALFCDADMLFLSDIKNLFSMCDKKYAVMCVKHNQVVDGNKQKMDGRLQTSYYRKNWSSFVLWNCGHPANKVLTKEYVNFAKGSDLHSFSWLDDGQIGILPTSYNYISGVSPKLPFETLPDAIHYTEGGPWFDNYKEVPFGELWLEEYENFQMNRGEYLVTEMPSMAFDKGI